MENTKSIPLPELVAHHNELAEELEVERNLATALKEIHEGEASDDPNFNFQLGKVIGLEMAVNSSAAFLITKGADLTGQLTPEQAIKKQD